MIIDSNVVIHAFIPSDLTAKARHVLSQVGLCAPDILIAEVANVFGRMVRTRAIDGAQAAELYAIFYKKHIILIKDAELKIIVAEKERVDKQKVTFGYKKTILLENKPGERKNKYLTKKDEEANKEKSILEKQIAKEEGLDWESWLMKEEERSD